jgi:hypothetical protein
MPVVFRYGGYRFFFFSNEGSPLEPPHIHVRQGERLAKFWLRPEVTAAESYGFSPAELNRLTGIIERHKGLIGRRWNEYFGV